MRHELDSYSTPDWLVEPILDRLTCYPIRTVLEPACGDGAYPGILPRIFSPTVTLPKVAPVMHESDE